MAFENLRPHQALILALQEQGRTLAQVADILQTQHGVQTTAPSLSRFIATLRSEPRRAPPPAPPVGIPEEGMILLRQLVGEIDGARTENREALEMLAGKVAAASADIVELEQALQRTTADLAARIDAIATQPAPATVTQTAQPARIGKRTLVTIWLRAFIIAFIAWGVLIGGVFLLAGAGGH